MARLTRSVLPALTVAIGLSLVSPETLAASSYRNSSPVGLASAPYTLGLFAGPPDVGLPPPPSQPPPQAKPQDKGGGGGGGGGIAAPPPAQPPSSGAPPGGSAPPPTAPPGGSPPIAAPPSASPPGGSVPPPPGGTPPGVSPPGISAPPAPGAPSLKGGQAPGGGDGPSLKSGEDGGNKATPKDKDAKKAEKEAEKAAKKAEKEAEKQAKEQEKLAEKEQKEGSEQPPEQAQPQDQPPGYQYPIPPQQWPYPYPPPNIYVNPQIQVQVNPRVDVEANPKSKADSDAKANAEAQANPVANAKSEVDTTIESKQVVNQQGSGGGGAPAPVGDDGPYIEEHIIQLPAPEQQRDYMADWRKPRRGPLITGLVLFGISYGSSAFAGYKLSTSCGKGNNFQGCKKTAHNMYIPVAGPAMNISRSPNATTQFAVAFAAGAQATGALLTVVGALILRRDRMHNRALERAAGLAVADNVYLGTAAGPTGGRLQLTGRF